jgi:hypothetical protein
LKWRKDNGAYQTTAQFQTNSFDLHPIVSGQYDFLIYSVNVTGRQSAPATISYTLNTAGGSSSATLSEITNLQIVGSGGTTWTGEDCNFTWTNPAANQGLLKDFVVTIKNLGGTTLRTIIADPVIGGQAQKYIYHFADNLADGLNRSLVVTVQGRDSLNNVTTGITATLTNPAPSVPSGITSAPFQQSAIVNWTPDTDTDVTGYVIWHSTTTGFTPSSGNAFDLGNVALASLNNLTKSTTYYYRVAAYDIFGKSLSGTGLNLSSELSFTTPSNVGVPSGSVLPSSGMLTGDVFYLTTTSTLYRYTGSAWVAVGIQMGSALPSSGMSQGDVFFLTTDSKLYRYTGSAWTKAVDGADITANSITASSIVAGTITTTQIAANTILGSNIAAGTITASNITATTITAAQIAAATITGSKIASGTITASNITAGTITGTEIAANSITSSHIVAGTIVSSDIAAGTITASNIATGTITATQIATNAVTAVKINVSQLSDVSATIGTLRTASSGARVEISDNLIQVFDASGNLRVKIGALK